MTERWYVQAVTGGCVEAPELAGDGTKAALAEAVNQATAGLHPEDDDLFTICVRGSEIVSFERVWPVEEELEGEGSVCLFCGGVRDDCARVPVVRKDQTFHVQLCRICRYAYEQDEELRHVDSDPVPHDEEGR